MAAEKDRKKSAAGSAAEGSLEEIWKLVENIDTAMLTTRRRDGRLVSRPMATQKRAPGADFWFVTAAGMPKLAEIAEDSQVNLAYYRQRNREWVSVSGRAEISRDRKTIRQLYAQDWKAWFADEGGGGEGGPEDPRIVLIGVRAESAQYMTVDKPQPVVLFEVLKGLVTGTRPDVGQVKEVSGRRSRSAAGRGAGRAGGRRAATRASGSSGKRRSG